MMCRYQFIDDHAHLQKVEKRVGDQPVCCILKAGAFVEVLLAACALASRSMCLHQEDSNLRIETRLRDSFQGRPDLLNASQSGFECSATREIPALEKRGPFRVSDLCNFQERRFCLQN